MLQFSDQENYTVSVEKYKNNNIDSIRNCVLNRPQRKCM